MNWHSRFAQQAKWTRELRAYLFRKAGLKSASRVLEVGCGTGAILAELDNASAAIHGVDIEPAHIKQAKIYAPRASLIRADAFRLPYPANSFDIVYCHFLLLWLPQPITALQEMLRVARPRGQIIAFAEPDYSQRIDEPEILAPLGRRQTEALRRQGADPDIGGRLAELFFQAGIHILETGAISPSAHAAPTSAAWELEWAVIEFDLAETMPQERIRELKELDRAAWRCGQRKLYVPTHYAWGNRKRQ